MSACTDISQVEVVKAIKIIKAVTHPTDNLGPEIDHLDPAVDNLGVQS